MHDEKLCFLLVDEIERDNSMNNDLSPNLH